jgi:hypothetical protein
MKVNLLLANRLTEANLPKRINRWGHEPVIFTATSKTQALRDATPPV